MALRLADCAGDDVMGGLGVRTGAALALSLFSSRISLSRMNPSLENADGPRKLPIPPLDGRPGPAKEVSAAGD